MFWYIPTTHKAVIVGLLAVAVVALVLFLVTRTLVRRQARREERELTAQAAIRHGVRTPDTPPAASRDE